MIWSPPILSFCLENLTLIPTNRLVSQSSQHLCPSRSSCACCGRRTWPSQDRRAWAQRQKGKDKFGGWLWVKRQKPHEPRNMGSLTFSKECWWYSNYVLSPLSFEDGIHDAFMSLHDSSWWRPGTSLLHKQVWRIALSLDSHHGSPPPNGRPSDSYIVLKSGTSFTSTR